MESNWTPFKFGKLAGVELVMANGRRGTSKGLRGEVHTTPSTHPEAPAPFYWDVISADKWTTVAYGFAVSVDAAKVECIAAMG